MYTITINHPEKSNLSVQIHKTPFGMPIAFYLGVGNKKNSYKNWLYKQFTHHPSITRSLVELHYMAKYNDSVNFVTSDKRSQAEAEVVKEFLETNRDTLGTLMSLYDLPQIDQSVLNTQKKITEQIEKQQSVIDSIIPVTEGEVEAC